MDLGRQVAYGIGIEETAGTPVAPSHWFNHLGFSLNPVVTKAANNSAWGNIVRTNGSSVVREHAEGNAEAKLTSNLGAIILALAMGDVSSVANSDASGEVYDHTIRLTEDIMGRTATLTRKDSVSTERFAGARFTNWELSLDLDGYLTFTADILAKKGEDTTATAAYDEQPEFVAKHLNIRQAASASAISSAGNISKVQEFSLSMNSNVEADNEAGAGTPSSFSSRGYELSFSMTKRHTDDTFKNAYENGDYAAWQTLIENTDETIGTSAHPAFQFTAPRVSIDEWERDGDLDNPQNEVMTGNIHFSPAEGYAIEALVTNTLATLI